MKTFLLSVILVSIGFVTSSFKKENPERPFSLKVNVSNIRNTKGSIYLYIYNYRNQYPMNPYRHYKIDKSKIRDGQLTYFIPELKKHDYAITLIDDENDNQDLDRVMGIPTEGFAFSNNLKAIKLPKYEKLLFTVQSKNQEINLKVRYL